MSQRECEACGDPFQPRAPRQKFCTPECSGAVPPHRCGGCTTRFSGANTCHCGSCHATFGGLAPFDKHQQRGRCIDPANDRWFQESRPGVWSQAAVNGREKAAVTPKKGHLRERQ